MAKRREEGGGRGNREIIITGIGRDDSSMNSMVE